MFFHNYIKYYQWYGDGDNMDYVVVIKVPQGLWYFLVKLSCWLTHEDWRSHQGKT